MSIASLPTYDELKVTFDQAEINVAESHGMVCGYICAGSIMNGKSWLDAILGHSQLSKELLNESRTLLLELYQASAYQLQSEAFDFQLLLPDDEEPLPMRAEALSNWCLGFITALKSAGINIETITPEAKEAGQNLLGISQLDYENIEVSEADEKAYTEVLEYVRVAVLMMYMEIHHNQGEKEAREGKNLH
jgi:yecA family protein